MSLLDNLFFHRIWHNGTKVVDTFQPIEFKDGGGVGVSTVNGRTVVDLTGIGSGSGATSTDTIKEPVYDVVTSHMSLSGLTVNGATVPAGARIAPLNQSDPKASGIYVAAAGSWARAADWDVGAHPKAGCQFVVAVGSALSCEAGSKVQLETSNVTVNTTNVSFRLEPYKAITVADNSKVLQVVSGRATPSGLKLATTMGTEGQTLRQRSGVGVWEDGGSAVVQSLATTLPAQDKLKVTGALVLNNPGNNSNDLDLGRRHIGQHGGCDLATTTTATGTTGSAVVTTAAALAMRNGQWAFWAGSGPVHGLATPGTPVAAVQGTTGSTTFAVKCAAITSTYGCSIASAAVTVTTANATLSTTNFVEVWAAPVANAKWYAWYVSRNGGAYTFAGMTIAYPLRGRTGFKWVTSLRLTSNSYTKTAPCPHLTAVPASAVPNGARYKIVSGAGTTSVTLDRVPRSNATATEFGPCNNIPLEDAMADVSGEIFLPYGLAWRYTGDIQIGRSGAHSIKAVNRCKEGGTAWFKMKDGAQFRVDNNRTAPQVQPGTLYRVGDRAQRTDPSAGTDVILVVQSISGGATWGATGVAGTEPAWNETHGATTVWGEVTFVSGAVFPTALTGSRSTLDGLNIEYEGSAVPPGQYVLHDDLRVSQERFLDLSPFVGGTWVANTVVPAGSYCAPTDGNATGKMYYTAAGGTTHATTEPTWSRVNAANTTDNTITWVTVDMRPVQGAALYNATPISVLGGRIVNSGGTGWITDGRSDATGTNANRTYSEGLTLEGNAGHGRALVGRDANTCLDVMLTVKSTGATCAVQDSSNYGGTWICPQNDSLTCKYQNNIAGGSSQFQSILFNPYQEGSIGESICDWHMPGQIIGGNLLNFTAETTATRRGVGTSGADIGDFTFADSASSIEWRLRNNQFAIDYIVGTASALTFGSVILSYNTTTKRWQHSLKTVNTSVPLELVAHGSYGKTIAAPNGISFGAGGMAAGNAETRLTAVGAIPTVGAFPCSAELVWVATVGTRLPRRGIIATQRGVLGATTWAANTTYAAGSIVFNAAANRAFVLINDTSRLSHATTEPAEFATAVLGQHITDNQCTWEYFNPSTQGPGLRAIPHLEAAPVTMAATNTALLLTDGPVFKGPGGATSYEKTLSATGAMAGDRAYFFDFSAGSGVFTLKDGPSAATIATSTTLTKWFVTAEFDGTNWGVVMPWNNVS